MRPFRALALSDDVAAVELGGERALDAAAANQVVRDHLEESARQGARTVLIVALNEEVDGYLGRRRVRHSRRRLADEQRLSGRWSVDSASLGMAKPP